ncbi:ABC transporter ATP-binding protein [Candidatus Poribacteria bacterium]
MHGMHMHHHSDEESEIGFYDKTLMSRLVKFLAPHKYKFMLALILMLVQAGYMMVGPYLQKIAIDDYILPVQFTVDVALQEELDNGAIPAGLRRSFADDGISLSQNAAVSIKKPGSRWVITDGEDQYLVTKEKSKLSISDGSFRGLTAIAILLVIMGLFNAFISASRSYTLAWMGRHVIYDISVRLFSHIQRLSMEFFDKRETGKIISRITNDVQALDEMVTRGVASVAVDLVSMLGIMAFMLYMNVKLSLLSFTLLPVLFLVAWLFRKRGRAAFREVRKKVADVTAKLEEGISGVRVVKSFSRENTNIQHFDKTNVENVDANMQAVKIWSIYYPIIEVITAVGTCIVVWHGGFQIMGEELTRGEFVAFLRYVYMFYMPVRQLTRVFSTMQSAMAASERIFEIMDTQPGVEESPDAVELPAIVGHVEYKDASFAYEEGEYVLHNISLTAEAGQTVAIVGPTGAGKSTIVSLLARLYNLEEGEVTIDGYNINNVTLASLRSQMGIVLQDSFLFSGTVRENIKYGNTNATEEEVIQAAEAVSAHRFISQLPNGYDTEVGERGAMLSVGQRQLVSFARALLADPRILILDEATSSVDAYTEMLIQRALEELLKNRTSFVIAHRLSTIINADKLLVIDEGKIVETGTHQELLAQGGLYQKLYNMQFISEAAS